MSLESKARRALLDGVKILLAYQLAIRSTTMSAEDKHELELISEWITRAHATALALRKSAQGKQT